MNVPFAGRGVAALLGSLGTAMALAAADATPAGHADHVAPAGEAANPPPPRPQDFLFLGPEPNTVRIVLVTSYNAANYGMNFNGHSKGSATYVVPVGWEVEVAFTNRSAVPHSAVVVERAMTRRVQVGDPAFEGASTPQPLKGTTGSKGVQFRFKASEAGDYAIACGFPSHSANGHWIAFEVSDKAKAPSLKLGKEEPYTPSK